jgi:arylsulfatase A-like enzyme
VLVLTAIFWSFAKYPALPADSPAPMAILEAPPARGRAERVVIVSIDGLRPDAIDVAKAETLKKLIARGAYCPKGRTVRPSLTLPSHTSMLTGLDAHRHQVYWNNYHSGYLPHPTVFSVVTQSGARSAMFFSKEKFHFLAHPKCVAHVYGPPVSNKPTSSDKDSDDDKINAAAIAREFASAWPRSRFALSFVHFRETDTKGHHKGWMTPEYIEAVARVDRSLGVVIAAIEDNGGFEKTALIVTSDHGGSGKGHYDFFQQETVHVTIPWICVGPGIPAGLRIDREIRVFDTAPTALALIGLGAPASIEGKAILEVLR